VHYILHNKSFPIHHTRQQHHKPIDTNSDNKAPKQKAATFTSTRKEPTFTTRLFERTNLKIACNSNNCWQHSLITITTHNSRVLITIQRQEMCWAVWHSFINCFMNTALPLRIFSIIQNLPHPSLDVVTFSGKLENIAHILHFNNKDIHIDMAESVCIYRQPVRDLRLAINVLRNLRKSSRPSQEVT